MTYYFYNYALLKGDEEPFTVDNRLASTPGVSINPTIPFNIVYYLLSLVIPYYLSTIANLYPIIQLKRLLFPQLGNPTNDTLNLSVFYL